MVELFALLDTTIRNKVLNISNTTAPCLLYIHPLFKHFKRKKKGTIGNKTKYGGPNHVKADIFLSMDNTEEISQYVIRKGGKRDSGR